MNQPQILNIQLGVNGVQLVLNALAKMPFDQVAELIAVIRVQADQQLNPRAPADPKQPAARKRAGRPKGSRNKAKAAPAAAAPTDSEGGAVA